MTAGNEELADQLAQLAALLRARRGDRFRARAYDRAARVLRALPVDVAVLAPEEVRRLSGIGAAIAGMVDEHVRTGRIGLLDELAAEEPPGFAELLGLPLIGVRDARALAGRHGVAGVAALREAVGDLAAADERLAARAVESLRRLATVRDDRLPLPVAQREAAALAAALADLPAVAGVAVAGSTRRGCDTVGRLRLVVATDRPEATAAALPAHRALVRLLPDDPPYRCAVTAGGRRADLLLAAPQAAGAALVVATGAQAHVAALQRRAAARGLALRADGLWRGATPLPAADEAQVYGALELPVVPPELREGSAVGGPLPRLVAQEDLRGDLHVHSDWSGDGKAGLDAVVAAAAARGYAYVAITDHAEDLAINGMSREVVLARRKAIAALQARTPELRILDAVELNIGLDGGLDYDLDFLLAFDLGVASIHSHMDRDAGVQTDRILAAIAHPAVHVVGHPTGRLLGRRPGYGIELEAIVQAAAETGTALEVNGSPWRLDLTGEQAAVAVQGGAMLSLASDAHSVGELGNVAHAVSTARRGGATPADVLGCRSLDVLTGGGGAGS